MHRPPRRIVCILGLVALCMQPTKMLCAEAGNPRSLSENAQTALIVETFKLISSLRQAKPQEFEPDYTYIFRQNFKADLREMFRQSTMVSPANYVYSNRQHSFWFDFKNEVASNFGLSIRNNDHLIVIFTFFEADPSSEIISFNANMVNSDD